MEEVTHSDILDAATRICSLIHHTPLLSCASLAQKLDCQLWFKCEHFQRTGSFKFRGACNAVFSLPPGVAERGVLTHSSGNHGQALARAAALRRIPAYVIMPEGAVQTKVEAVLAFGGKLIRCGNSLDDRERVAAAVASETGAHLVHPYDDPSVIAGQGTVGLELLERLPEVDVVVAPVGGGGLLSGVCLAVHAQNPRARIYAAEPRGADDAARSLRSGYRQSLGQTDTVADGLRAQLSERTFAILRQHLEDVVVVDDTATVHFMRLLWQRTKWVVEASAAVAFAALHEPALSRHCRGKHVAVILTGGNVDLDRLSWLVSRPYAPPLRREHQEEDL